MAIYLKRLAKGLLYAGLSLYVIFHEFGTNSLGSYHRWGEAISKWAKTQSGFVSTIADLLYFILILGALIYLVKGVFFLMSLNVEEVPAVEVSLKELFRKPCTSSGDDTENIDRIKRYRDSKLAAMTNSDAAKEYKKTAWVDGLTSDSGPHTQATRRYINAQLAAKTNEQGYQWLKDHRD